MRKEQSEKYQELKNKAISLYKEADRVSREAEDYYEEEIYWEDQLARNPDHMLVQDLANGRKYLTKKSRIDEFDITLNTHLILDMNKG